MAAERLLEDYTGMSEGAVVHMVMLVNCGLGRNESLGGQKGDHATEVGLCIFMGDPGSARRLLLGATITRLTPGQWNEFV